MSKPTKSIIGGMTVLGLTGIICKLIGVLYSIPLSNILTPKGLGLFQAVFPTYNLLLTISSAGIPVAVSRMVSHALAKNQDNIAKRVFYVALIILTAIGSLFTLLSIFSSSLLSNYVGQEEAKIGFIAIAPCVAIVCMLSAFRGYMQGHQNMVPTAISQLIEQVGKVIISIPLAAYGMKRGGIEYGAAGALLGITIVELLALLYMVFLYLYQKKRFTTGSLEQSSEYSHVKLAARLFVISFPITISACIVPLAQFVDSAMIVKRLTDYSGVSTRMNGLIWSLEQFNPLLTDALETYRMIHMKLDLSTARSLYGIFSGQVIRLINIPTALALSISMSLVPAISSAYAVQDQSTIRQQSNLGLRFAFIIGFPCSVGMSLLSKNIIAFFYGASLSNAQLEVAGQILRLSALTIVLFTAVQATTAILQGIHKQAIPMYTLIAGVACKILLNYILVGTPGINILGGPIASIACYSVSLVPNLFFAMRDTKMRFNWKDWLFKPLLSSACMGIVIFIMQRHLAISHLNTILMIGTGILVYLVSALLTKTITRSDLSGLRRRKKV